jgi:hypothetical protein
MAGERILVKGTPKTLEASGAAIANNALAQADDATYDIFTDGGSMTDARIGLQFAYATAPTEGTVLAIYAQPLDIIGTGDAEAPEATRPTVYIGSVVVNNVTTTQYAELIARDLPWKASYYLHNNGTGQSVSAGWVMEFTPCTDAAAA